MRFTQPVNDDQSLPYGVVKVQGCADVTVGFNILNEEPQVSKRRYCNKVLVHECVSIPVPDPIDLVKAEFMATDDPCYSVFNVFKSSVLIDDIQPTVTLQLNGDNLVIGLLVKFAKTDTCCMPLRMSYRFYGYPPEEGTRILLSQGNLFITPCSCVATTPTGGTSVGCGGNFWTDVNW